MPWNGDLAARDRAAKQERDRRSSPPNNLGQTITREAQRDSKRPRKLHEAYYETEDAALRHDEGLDNEDVLALEEFLAAAEGDMTMADRTWGQRDSSWTTFREPETSVLSCSRHSARQEARKRRTLVGELNTRARDAITTTVALRRTRLGLDNLRAAVAQRDAR